MTANVLRVTAVYVVAFIPFQFAAGYFHWHALSIFACSTLYPLSAARSGQSCRLKSAQKGDKKQAHQAFKS